MKNIKSYIKKNFKTTYDLINTYLNYFRPSKKEFNIGIGILMSFYLFLFIILIIFVDVISIIDKILERDLWYLSLKADIYRLFKIKLVTKNETLKEYYNRDRK